jgi:hypothetical protein
MKSINTKLILSALGIALLATPAFAQNTQQNTHRHVSNRDTQIQRSTGYAQPSEFGSESGSGYYPGDY